jgi:hypothetical protein
MKNVIRPGGWKSGIRLLAVCVFAAGVCPAAVAKGTGTVLSEQGCGRATAYSEFNKIVTVGQRTHVSWLDSVGGRFMVRIRTFDRAKDAWSPVYTVGEAYDNHGGPSLAADNSGYLHIVYYPHHHPFRYRRSQRPNDASAWTEEKHFGKKCTYSSLICLPDDTLVLACRQSSPKQWLLNLYTKAPDGEWTGPKTILHGAAKAGYTRWQGALAQTADGKTLHMSFMLYEQTLGEIGYAVGYLKSTDSSASWGRPAKEAIELPVSPATIEIVAGARAPDGRTNFRPGNIAIDPDGMPWVIYSRLDRQPYETFIAHPAGSGWKKISILPAVRAKWPDRAAKTPGGIAFDKDGVMYLAVTTIDANVSAAEAMWGHPSAEVVLLVSRDKGRTFSAYAVSAKDDSVPNWLPNLERPTGHRPTGVPSLIYTHGHRGGNNKQIMSNDVVWCDVRSLIGAN